MYILILLVWPSGLFWFQVQVYICILIYTIFGIWWWLVNVCLRILIGVWMTLKTMIQSLDYNCILACTILGIWLWLVKVCLWILLGFEWLIAQLIRFGPNFQTITVTGSTHIDILGSVADTDPDPGSLANRTIVLSRRKSNSKSKRRN